MHDAPRIGYDALTSFLANIFQNLGMTADNAEICADDIVLTNLWGIDSHGVLRLPIYAQRLNAGRHQGQSQGAGAGRCGRDPDSRW